MILIFGGTSDSLAICKALGEADEKYMVSVTTEYGRKLTERYTTDVLEGKLDRDQMREVIKAHEVEFIIDATHPYAIEASKNVIEVSKELDIPYIRYERASLLKEVSYEKLYVAKNTEEAISIARGLGGTIFLGTGSKTLKHFTEGLKEKTLIVRVLPTSDVIKECEALGLNPDNIVGMKGPFSEEMNEMMYKHYGADCVITKESGSEGGFLEKIRPCMRLGLNVIVIKRDRLEYPNLTHDIKTILEQVKQIHYL